MLGLEYHNCEKQDSCKTGLTAEYLARVTIVSRTQFRMRRAIEPRRISYKMVTRLSYGKKRSIKIIHAEICPEIIEAEGYIVWIPSLSFLRAI